MWNGRKSEVINVVIISVLFYDCFRCLDECNYDLKEALRLFVDLYKNDKIPEGAFEING